MLLPEMEIMIARDRIERRMQEIKWGKQLEASLREQKQNAKQRPERGWLRQLFLGKAGA